jgi:protein-S-isoprenylcysteine O-methyltransferase Ste14
MTETDTARLLLALIVGAVIIAGVAMRRAGMRPGGGVPRSADGRLIATAIGVLGISFHGGLLLFLAWPTAMEWAAVDVPGGARWTGAAMLASGVALAFWARWTLAAHSSSTLTAVPAPGASLVTRGPYRRLRHPIYSAGLLMIPGAAALTANLFILAAGLGGLAVLAARTPREEALLLAEFGDDYRNVLDRTGRWLPRFRRPERQP